MDIIAFGWGYDKEKPDVAEAVEIAQSENIVIIAAAGNTGAEGQVQFPAGLKNVFCIGSADGLGNLAQSNPLRSNNNGMFSILGEEVLGAESGTNGYTRRSGSEVAAMIASGVAALLIDYNSRNYPRRRGPYSLENLRKLFSAISESSQGQNYRYLVPFSLFTERTDSLSWLKSIVSHPEGTPWSLQT